MTRGGNQQNAARYRMALRHSRWLVTLLIVADGYEDALSLARRRDQFTSAEFSYEIAPDEQSAVVLLLPERRALTVSGASVDYVRVRLFDSLGRLLGCMACGPHGRVGWSGVDR